MQATVVETPTYLARASKIMSAAEMNSIVNFVSAAPESGDIIKGSGGLRKARVALGGRGKSGGARVIYWYYNESFPAVLLWAFAKNETENITKSQLATLAKYSVALRNDFRRSK
jgi:hypothetical protein